MKKRYTTAALLLLLCIFPTLAFSQCDDVTVDSITNPGPYQVATLDESDGIRNGPDYDGATIYYPTDGTPPYASIALVTGFFSEPEDIEEWGPFYASHGIVVINIGTNFGGDLPDARADGLLDALETLRQENVRNGSPLEGDIDDTKFAVGGWSMGGGGAQRAAVLDPSIKAVVALCPWLDTGANLSHSTPVLIFSGQFDPTAPPAIHANVHYANTPDETQKVLFEIENGNHSVANTPTGAGGVIGKIALSWLKLYVEENDCYCGLLNDSLLVDPVASLVETNIDAECAALGVEAIELADLSLYPNPTNSTVFLPVKRAVDYQVFSSMGTLVLKGKLTADKNHIDVSQLPASIYYVRVKNETFKIIKTE
jgi:pimeloyl-ACP methyl ester carboxylesterase